MIFKKRTKSVKGYQTSPALLVGAQCCFIQNVKQVMSDRKITAEKMAKISGLDVKQIRKILAGQMKPSRSFLQALANIDELAITYKDLVVWSLLDESLQYANDNNRVLEYAV